MDGVELAWIVHRQVDTVFPHMLRGAGEVHRPHLLLGTSGADLVAEHVVSELGDGVVVGWDVPLAQAKDGGRSRVDRMRCEVAGVCAAAAGGDRRWGGWRRNAVDGGGLDGLVDGRVRRRRRCGCVRWEDGYAAEVRTLKLDFLLDHRRGGRLRTAELRCLESGEVGEAS